MSLPVGKGTNYGLGVACVVFLIIAGWYAFDVIAAMQTWNDWDKPAMIAKMKYGIIFGLIGSLFACGVNVLEILSPILRLIPGLKEFVPKAADSEVPPPPANVGG